jgi:acetyl-CoA carboxylase biotin carboxyl carrier protein
VELKDIKDIIDLMKENDLSVFEMEKEGFKLKLQKNAATPNGPPILAAPIALAPTGLAAPAPSGGESAAGGGSAAPEAGTREIVSPMVGTFYRSPAPGSGPFVDVGQTVNEDTVVGIIEAMKVMNEIKAETSGVITEVAAENGKPVQFGQVLFRVR